MTTLLLLLTLDESAFRLLPSMPDASSSVGSGLPLGHGTYVEPPPPSYELVTTEDGSVVTTEDGAIIVA